MIVLSVRTDKPEAELGVYKDGQQLVYETWQAHRQLAETIHTKLEQLLNKSSITMNELEGIVAFSGPGSFTGLRIGLATANALAYGLQIPIVATCGEDWIVDGIKKIQAGQDDKIALPEYGEPAKATLPRK